MVIITVYLEDPNLVTADRPSGDSNGLDRWSLRRRRVGVGHDHPHPHVGTFISGVSRCDGSCVLLVDPIR